MKDLRNRCKGKRICLLIFAWITGLCSLAIVIACMGVAFESGLFLIPVAVFINVPYWIAISGFGDVCDTVEKLQLSNAPKKTEESEVKSVDYAFKFGSQDPKADPSIQFDAAWLANKINTLSECDDVTRITRNRTINQILNGMLVNYIKVTMPILTAEQEQICSTIAYDYEDSVGRMTASFRQAVKVVVYQLFKD